MSYKTIVTTFRDAERDAAHLEAAISLADAEEAHLRVLALGIERVMPDAYYGGGTVTLQSMSDAIEEARAAETAAAELLRRNNSAAELDSIVSQIGGVAHIIGRNVALADLVMLPKPYGEGRSAEDVAVTEAALFSTRTPIMVLPAGMSQFQRPKKIVAAWNQSTEALAAIRAALPLLRTAESVNVAIIDPPAHSAEESDPGMPLAEMLDRHGVNVEVSVLAKSMTRISDILNRHVSDIGADMVVMGAYGHSRFREAILGGATRNMLEQAAVPVFMAH